VKALGLDCLPWTRLAVEYTPKEVQLAGRVLRYGLHHLPAFEIVKLAL